MPEEYTDLDDVEVTDQFLEPLTAVLEGRELCSRFHEVWKEYAMELPKGNEAFSNWRPNILEIIAPCKADDALHASRVVTAIILWFGTGTGHPFMENLLKELTLNVSTSNSHKNLQCVLSAWAIENSLNAKSGGWGGRRLQRILHDDKQLIPLTNLEIDTAERFMEWLTNKSGIDLLQRLKVSSEVFFAKKR